AAERAGLGEAGIRPHSLRAGGATGAYLGGADPLVIGRHGRWRDGSRTVLGYIRGIDRWAHNPMNGTGL
ncbi:tyrosine-type recombinase/integrase, partial [Nonomuraea sp. H19]